MRKVSNAIREGVYLSLLLSIFLIGTIVHSEIGELKQALQTTRDIIMQSDYETSWSDNQGAMHTVRTSVRDGETAQEAAFRHQEKVQALQSIYPPV